MSTKDPKPSNLCNKFAEILNATPSVVNGVCLATRSRTNIHPTVMGRKAESFMFIPEAYSFESMDEEGRALCLGEIVILEEEINPFLSKLRGHGITVTALHNHFLFENPRLMFMHFEAIDRPLDFARRVADSQKVLKTNVVNSSVPGIGGDPLNLTQFSDEFNRILGGDMHTLTNGNAMVMISRTNIKPTVLGRRGKSFLLIPEMYAFDSVTKDGIALCSGETLVLEGEVNPFVSKLREHGLILTSVHNHWLFDNPRLMYLHFQSIEHPLLFARKVQDARSALTTTEVRPR